MKTVDEIYQEMTAAFSQATGSEAGGSPDLAARLYAVSAQIYALYVQAGWVERQCFPQTAIGEQLDMHAQLRGLERKGASHAQGTIRFTADRAAGTGREIPLGTVCMTGGMIRFVTTEAGTIPAGETWADVPARAAEPGESGNVPAGTILSMAVAPVGVSRCSNPAPFTGGAGEEGDEALRARVLETFRRMPNGANAAFYQQEALSFEEVAAASGTPRPGGTGSAGVAVATQAGTPDEELLEAVEAHLQARREIAVDVQVRAPTVRTVDVTVRVAPAANQEKEAVLGRVEAAIRAWSGGERLGKDVLRAELGEAVYHAGGVANYALLAPAADVAVEPDELPLLGALSVEEMA